MSEAYTFEVKCAGADTLPYESLDIFQGELKKRSDDDYRKIRDLILSQGFIAPFFVWKDGERNWILDGTGRAEALRDMKREGCVIPPLPVVYVECESKADAKEKLLAITSKFGKMSSKGLAEFTKGLTIDFERFGLEVFIPPQVKEGAEKTGEERAKNAPYTLPGDVWEIGRHRLVCGDAARAETFARLFAGENGEAEEANLLFTDPPYGVDYAQKIKDIAEDAFKGNTSREESAIANDDMKGGALLSLLTGVFTLCEARMADGAAFYVFSPSQRKGVEVMLAVEAAGLKVRQEITWCKDAPTFSMGRNDYEYMSEKIWYGWKGEHHFYGLGKQKTTLWNYKRQQKNAKHPTEKPAALIENAIENSMADIAEERRLERSKEAVLNNSVKGGIVLDPFAGSGSVMVAAETCKRTARLVEVNPRYCDVIAMRGFDLELPVTLIRGGRRISMSMEELAKSEGEKT